MSKVNTEYHGYFYTCGSDTREYLDFIDGEYKHMVYSKKHIYVKETQTKCFDENGNVLGVHKGSREREDVEETREVYKQKSVAQVNYDFKLLPIGRCVNMDEIETAFRLLENTFNIVDAEEYPNKSNLHEYNRAYYEKCKTRDYKENFIPFEICVIGYSTSITNKTNKTLEISIKEYTKNYDNFIKKHPRREEEAYKIYKANIGYLCLFWSLTKTTLLRDRFNRTNKAFDKLNRQLKLKTN